MVMQIRKSENEGTFVQEVMKRKMQEKNKDNIETIFAERKQEMNSFIIKCQKETYNMEQVQMEY